MYRYLFIAFTSQLAAISVGAQEQPNIAVGIGEHQLVVKGNGFIKGYFGADENYDEMCEVTNLEVISNNAVKLTFVVGPPSSEYASCVYYLEFADGTRTVTGTFASLD